MKDKNNPNLPNDTHWSEKAVQIPELIKEINSIEAARDLQLKYRKSLYTMESGSAETMFNIDKINLIAGIDVSYFVQDNEEWGIACVMLWDLMTFKVVQRTFYQDKVSFPYKLGFLGFREVPLMAKAILKLSTKPDIILTDGHGIIHPYRFGEAVHLGYALNIPSIGIAKKPFIGFIENDTEFKTKGLKSPIWDSKKINERELLGYKICLSDGLKAVYLSIGYKINIELALELALRTSTSHKQPEPLFLAHYFATEKIRELRGE